MQKANPSANVVKDPVTIVAGGLLRQVQLAVSIPTLAIGTPSANVVDPPLSTLPQLVGSPILPTGFAIGS